MAKEKRENFTFPAGVLVWPKLTKIDYGTDKFPKKGGEYNTKVLVDAVNPAVVAILAKLQPLMDKAVEDAKETFGELKLESRKKLQKDNGPTGIKVNDLYTEVFDEKTEEATGQLEFKFKMGASGTRKDGTTWTAKPALFDAKRQPLPKGVDIWGGTVAKIGFTAEPYFIAGSGAVGLTLRLGAVQVLDLVSSGNRSAASFGFEDEDGLDSSELVIEDNDDADAVPAEKTDAAADTSDDGNF